MRPEPSNRIHNRDNRRNLDIGSYAAAISKKGEPGLQQGVLQDLREECLPVICGAIFSRDCDDPLSRIELVCERSGWP